MIDKLFDIFRPGPGDPPIDQVYRRVRVFWSGADLRFMPHYAGDEPVEAGVTLWVSGPTTKGNIHLGLVSAPTASGCLRAVLADWDGAMAKMRGARAAADEA